MKIVCPNCKGIRNRKTILPFSILQCMDCGAKGVYVGHEIICKDGWAWQAIHNPKRRKRARDGDYEYRCSHCDKPAASRAPTNAEIAMNPASAFEVYPRAHCDPQTGRRCIGCSVYAVPLEQS